MVGQWKSVLMFLVMAAILDYQQHVQSEDSVSVLFSFGYKAQC